MSTEIGGPIPVNEIPDDVVQRAAREHHAAYEEAAPGYGYDTREESRVAWDNLPENMRALMLEAESRSLAAVLPDLRAWIATEYERQLAPMLKRCDIAFSHGAREAEMNALFELLTWARSIRRVGSEVEQ